jgi:Carboxymuconolactone decarboxylase family
MKAREINGCRILNCRALDGGLQGAHQQGFQKSMTKKAISAKSSAGAGEIHRKNRLADDDKGSCPTSERARSMAAAFAFDLHARDLKKAGEADERIFAVAAWRHTPYFTEAERAALALTEALTRLSDREDPVPGEIWDGAARHYDEKALAALVVSIARINVWNRLNVAVGQVVGEWKRHRVAHSSRRHSAMAISFARRRTA